MRSQTYMDRAMRSSDRRYARVLEKLGYGRPKTPAAPAAVETQLPAEIPDDLAVLRAEYEELVGKRPFMGWDADKLREKIAEARAAADGRSE